MESLDEKGRRLVVVISTPMDRDNLWKKLYLEGKRKMEKELVPNNTTLASLRELLRAARKKVLPEQGVCVELRMWDYEEKGRAVESIGVYRSGKGEGTSFFRSLEEAHEYIDGWKEEEDANTSSD